RASAFASIVFPTPGKSSMIRCPSPARHRTARRRVSSGACTTRPTFAATASSRPAASVAGRGSLRASTEHPLHLVQHRRGNLGLRPPRHLPPPVPPHDHPLLPT